MVTENKYDNSAKASVKSLKISPQKANLVLQMIRGKKADRALNILQFSKKRISHDIQKILKAAISNAENNHQLDIDKLFVQEATVGRSMVMKRFRPRARGRSGKILKTFSKIRIIVKEQELKKVVKENTKLKLKKEEDGSKS